MVLAVAKYYDDIKLFAERRIRPPEARRAMDGFRRSEAEEQGQDRSRGEARASKTHAKSHPVRRNDRGANERAGRQGCTGPKY